MPAHLDKLNPEQRRAVTTTEGPVLVLAGAGTGKTRVITFRIAHLLSKRVPPEQILAVTFTNKAAREMRERIGELVGRERVKKLTIGTFHAFCARALREHGTAIGHSANFSICDAADQVAAVRAVLRELHAPEGTIHPRALQAAISLLKNRLVTASQAAESAADDLDHLVARAYAKYDEALRRAKCLDFDDLLLETLRLLREDTATRTHMRERFRYLMVDEYQDTNGPQYEIVRNLAGSRRNLCVVGDDDQSIYGWRGADVKKILEFERDFPGCAVIRLETNYRSTKPILEAANAVIRCNTSRHSKTLRSFRGKGDAVKVVAVDDEEREARGVVADLQKRVLARECKYQDVAILFRTAVQPRAFEAVLRERRIPYVVVGGQSFFDRKEVRDVLAFLRLVGNPDDEPSLLRVINTPPRGVGKTSVDRLNAFASARGIVVPRALEHIDEVEGLTPAARDGLRRLASVLERFRSKEPGGSLVDWLRDLIDALDYKREVERCYPDRKAQEQRWNGVMEILNFAENFTKRESDPTLRGFLEVLALTASDDSPAEEKGPRNSVTLMTLHSAKGLEYPRVYLVGIEEGILPHLRSVAEDQVEEERRLMYVGITRAQRHLTITHAKERARFGRRVECMPSRFLFEMQDEPPPEDWRPAGTPERPAAKRASKKPKRARR